MKFVEEHLTTESFLRAPHRWFLSFLLSPFHFAALHYKKRYHLQYRHARKLFTFDLMLLVGTVFLIATTIFWHMYDPTVTSLVNLNVIATPYDEPDKTFKRIPSGSHLTITVSFSNKSDTELLDPMLAVATPKGFVIESAEPAEQYAEHTGTFKLPVLKPGASGSVRVHGFLFGTPDHDELISTHLSYTQAGRDEIETKTSHLLTTLRDSILVSSLETQDAVLSHGKTMLTYKLSNVGDTEISAISVPLIPPAGFAINSATTTFGTVDTSNVWTILKLDKNQTASLNAILSVDLDDRTEQATITLTPRITVNNTALDQTKSEFTYKIIHPNLRMASVWSGLASGPGETNTLTIEITNSGDATLRDITLSIPVPAHLINQSKLIQLNHGSLQRNVFVLSDSFDAGLQTLDPGQTTSVRLQIPIAQNPAGDADITLRLTPRIEATVVSGNAAFAYEQSFETVTVPIGTRLSLYAESRYYTDEGDQLGRGPLPPQVGTQTKYWALITMNNSSSGVRNVRLNARVPEAIEWTGRTSVSQGEDLSYNPETRTVSWIHPYLDPHETVGVYMELGFTPSSADVGHTPDILTAIHAEATDTYIELPVEATIPSIDSSLPHDKKARQKGVAVQ